jgi:hypothetical protein
LGFRGLRHSAGRGQNTHYPEWQAILSPGSNENLKSLQRDSGKTMPTGKYAISGRLENGI